MRIGVLGINNKLADLQLRESLAKVCHNLFSANNVSHGPHTIVLLSTCNRTELYFASEDLASAHIYLLNLLRLEVSDDFDQKVYSYFGVDCFMHLCRVTTGLDSAILGETEIQGQVKNAYERATEYVALPKELHYLFQKALMIGKKVRLKAPLKKNHAGLEHAVLNAGLCFFKELKKVKILFVGASEINLKIINFFKIQRLSTITICTRNSTNAKIIAESQHLQWLEWNDLSEWHDFDWIIFGTKATNHLLTKDVLLSPFQEKKLLIDLSVPRNVDPDIGKDPRLMLLNIDQLNSTLTAQLQQMEAFLSKAQQLIHSSVRMHANIFIQKQLKAAWLPRGEDQVKLFLA